MKASSFTFLRVFVFSFFLISTFAGCSRGVSNPFADSDGEVKENIQNLMGLAVGMTKGQVFDLSGIANYVEGYDWGSVWFYKIRKEETKEPLRTRISNKDTCRLFLTTPTESWGMEESFTTKPFPTWAPVSSKSRIQNTELFG